MREKVMDAFGDVFSSNTNVIGQVISCAQRVAVEFSLEKYREKITKAREAVFGSISISNEDVR